MEQGIVPFEREELTPTMMLNEYIMTSLRTAAGCSLSTVKERFGAGKQQALLNAAQEFIGKGWMKKEQNVLILTKEGRLFADGIASDLFFD
jgi:oxygen-independent coproporphyrinogen-3 oxidase